ncbi:MAG: hypothetical protein V1793_20145 [Pseudomonadota bacterium]
MLTVKLLAVLGWILLCYSLERKYLILYPFVVVSSIISALYVSGLAGMLPAGYYLILTGGLIAGSVCLIRSGIDRSWWDGMAKEPGFIVLVAAIFLYTFFVPPDIFAYWDEWAFWGLVPKEMMLTGALRGPSSFYGLHDYPPGTALLQYFFAMGTEKSIQACYVAQFTMIASAIAVMGFPLRWKHAPLIPVVLFAIFYGVSNFGHGFSSLYVDHLIAVYFAMIVVACLVSGLRSWALCFLAPPLFTLVLIKKAGLFFAVLAVVIIVCDLCVRDMGSQGNKSSQVRIKTFLGQTFQPWTKAWIIIVPVLLVALAPFLAHQTWKTRVDHMNVSRSFSAPVTLTMVREGFSGEASESLKIIRSNFKNFFWKQGFSNSDRFPVPVWTMILAAIMLAGLHWNRLPGHPGRGSIALSILLFGNGIFFFSLLVMYMFSFNAYEGPRLASVQRYCQTPMLGFYLVAFSCLIPRGWNPGKHRAALRNGLLLTLIISGCYLFEPIPIDPAETASSAYSLSETTANRHRPALELIKKNVAQDSKVFIIVQNSKGFEFRVIRFFLFPLASNDWFWSVGRLWNQDDVWTNDLSIQELSDKLQDYDYLYIGEHNPNLWTQYGVLFKDPVYRSPGIYAILKSPESELVKLAVPDFCLKD